MCLLHRDRNIDSAGNADALGPLGWGTSNNVLGAEEALESDSGAEEALESDSDCHLGITSVFNSL